MKIIFESEIQIQKQFFPPSHPSFCPFIPYMLNTDESFTMFFSCSFMDLCNRCLMLDVEWCFKSTILPNGKCTGTWVQDFFYFFLFYNVLSSDWLNYWFDTSIQGKNVEFVLKIATNVLAGIPLLSARKNRFWWLVAYSRFPFNFI